MGSVVRWVAHPLLLLLVLLLWRPDPCLGQGDYFKTRTYIHPGLPGPWVKPTKGEVWPKPHSVKDNGKGFSVLDPNNFEFQMDEFSADCDVIVNAVRRFPSRIFPKQKDVLPFDDQHPWFDTLQSDANFRGAINTVQIVMNNDRGCKEKYPKMDMDEHYEVKVDSPDEPGQARIIAFSQWGILRGMETFSQLVFSDKEQGGMYKIRSTQIMDQPRFSWRGVMLDSSRHFLSKRVLLDNLDAMEMNKMNVFHWHLTDDNAFPYQSFTFPKLSDKGAYNPRTHVYSQEDIADVIEYARMRGIRVVPEFDTPGHTESWGLGMPDLLTRCYRGGQPNGLKGPMNPIDEDVYTFVRRCFPDAIVIGEAKCGTSAFRAMMLGHSQGRAPKKEVHFYNYYQERGRGRDWYLSKMPAVPKDALVMEKTPAYFRTLGAPREILKTNPATRAILLLRDPVERVLSHQNFCRGWKRKTTRQRACSNRKLFLPDGSVNEECDFVKNSRYSVYLKRWLAEFPQSQLLILDYHDFKKRPWEAFDQVQDFLGIRRDFERSSFEARVTEQGSSFYCWWDKVQGVLTCPKASPRQWRGTLTPENARKLKQFFVPYEKELRRFFKEVTTVFPDKYVHLGGDEVDLECWQSNPQLKDYVQKNLNGQFRKLEALFFKRLLEIIESYPTNNGYIVWQEVFDNQDQVKNDTVVEVWKGGESNWKETVEKITRSGHRALLSSPWYLNYISYGADWVKYYNVDPGEFGGDENQKKLLMGGEACLWAEFVNSVNLLPRLWPRASAVAERLWSPRATTKDVKEAASRLQEMECRMLQRGYPVEPANGPGFCEVMWDKDQLRDEL